MIALQLLLLALLPLSTAAPDTGPGRFAGPFSLELISDSFWSRCELKISVAAGKQGLQSVECLSDEGVQTAHAAGPLAARDVAQLRKLLRDAHLFQGQFWGSDHRGLDAPFVTLAVHDDSQAAVLVCVRNESFERGSRQELLMWLLDRVGRVEQRGRSK